MKALESLGKAFAISNPERVPANLGELLPYVTTPEQKAAVAKQIQFQESDPATKAIAAVMKAFIDGNPGVMPRDTADLLHHATTPEQQEAVRAINLQFPGEK